MALSIGPNQSALAAGNAQRTSAASGSQALNQGTLRTTIDPSSDDASSTTIPPVQAEERRATGILFNASSSITLKQNATQNLLETVTQLQERSEAIERETNPTRRQELVEESEALVVEAQEQFEAAVEENPSIAQNETITAVLAPGTASGTGPTTFSTSITSAPSAATVGLDQVDFSNPQAAQSALSDIAGSLRGTLNSLQSVTTDVAAAVRSRGQAIAAEETAASAVNIDQRAEELAQEVAASAEGLTEASQVERLDVSTLLAAEEASARRSEQSEEQDEPAPGPDDSDQRGLFASEDPVSAGNRLVQN